MHISNEKNYVKRSVVAAGKLIREAVEIKERQVVHHCRRCGVELEHDEYVRSQKAKALPAAGQAPHFPNA